jgi:two-component system sporulation sensor kinase B
VVQSVLLPVIHGLLYMIAACLLFLVINPKFMFDGQRRKLLFLAILTLLSFVYLGYEEHNPMVYALHLIPISIALASLYEGAVPGIATWAAFVFCGIFVVETEGLPTLLAGTVILGLGLFLHYKMENSSHNRMSFYTISLVMIYLLIYLTTHWLQGRWEDSRLVTVIVTMTLISSLFTNFIYFYVKHQERFQRELILSEKYQLIGQLAASLSHEIRNPLTTTRGFLQLMGNENVSKEAMERYRTYAFEGIDHANSIITDYLNFSKPSLEEPTLLNVREEVDGVISWLHPFSVVANITINVHHLADTSLQIWGEPKKFQQCLLNVMKNAIESMPEGGSLTVHTRLKLEMVQIIIRDTGVGMSSTAIKRVGRPYFTTKESGTGLGLMVVVSLVKAMNGKIYFRSKPNEGTICEMHFGLITNR